MSETHTNFFFTQGTMHQDTPSYVRRQADEDLLAGLMAGSFCYVLTTRQMGKSSLMVRTSVQLRAEGVSVVILDLTKFGDGVTREQWYRGLLSGIGRHLGLSNELEEFWRRHEHLGPLQRLMSAVREVALERIAGRVVIFVDEIDCVRSLPFSTDEFFAGIRELYNRRTQDAALERLTFCLLGTVVPSDLIRDKRTTPFNIGTRIVTGSGDSTAMVWDAATGRLEHKLEGHKESVAGMAFSPDGRHIVTGSGDRIARIWDVNSAKVIHELKGYAGGVNRVAYSRDGRRIVTSSNIDGTAKVWDPETGREVLTLKGHTAGIVGVAISPDGRRIATCSDDGTAKIWDVNTPVKTSTVANLTP